MKFDELLNTIDEFDEYLSSKFPTNTFREKMFARTVKLNEEVGELCNEVLAYDGDQRAEKLTHTSQESLNDEFADVILTTLILAKTMDVDIQKALARKVHKIRGRFKQST